MALCRRLVALCMRWSVALARTAGVRGCVQAALALAQSPSPAPSACPSCPPGAAGVRGHHGARRGGAGGVRPAGGARSPPQLLCCWRAECGCQLACRAQCAEPGVPEALSLIAPACPPLTQVSYDALLAEFWQRHDPTQLNRQGGDVGTQYRCARDGRARAPCRSPGLTDVGARCLGAACKARAASGSGHAMPAAAAAACAQPRQARALFAPQLGHLLAHRGAARGGGGLQGRAGREAGRRRGDRGGAGGCVGVGSRLAVAVHCGLVWCRGRQGGGWGGGAVAMPAAYAGRCQPTARPLRQACTRQHGLSPLAHASFALPQRRSTTTTAPRR